MKKLEYVFETTLISAYDGDTLTMLDDLGHDILAKSKVRLTGINTPEIRGGTPVTKAAAKVVRDYVRWWCLGAPLISHSYKGDKDKYGRWLVRIYKEGEMLNEHLLSIGFAYPYDGGTKKPWTDEDANFVINSKFNFSYKESA